MPSRTPRRFADRPTLQRLLAAAALAGSLALSACAGTPRADEMPSSTEPAPSPADSAAIAAGEPAPPPPRPRPRCNAELAQAHAAGKTADTATVERARVDAGGDVVRVLKPGQFVTKEYREGRVNVYVDENNVVISVSCG
ncbi:I78 family peptidase inhibitor [Lysobacter firmicutimachus]|uniref:I78 family peptidase inhibitor n=1 Tax=Lysobacter firmicutimachus TaxID=1792846 RepID=A0AAU8MY20_9GAMM